MTWEKIVVSESKVLSSPWLALKSSSFYVLMGSHRSIYYCSKFLCQQTWGHLKKRNMPPEIEGSIRKTNYSNNVESGFDSATSLCSCHSGLLTWFSLSHVICYNQWKISGTNTDPRSTWTLEASFPSWCWESCSYCMKNPRLTYRKLFTPRSQQRSTEPAGHSGCPGNLQKA